MNFYKMIGQWIKACNDNGILDELAETPRQNESEPKRQQPVTSARQERREAVNQEIDSALIEKQAEDYLAMAESKRQQAKDYLARGLKGMAQNCINAYNELVDQAGNLQGGALKLESIVQERIATQMLLKWLEKNQKLIDEQVESAEQLEANMEKLAEARRRMAEINKTFAEMGKTSEYMMPTEGKLSVEILEEEIAQDIQIETDSSPLREAMVEKA